MTPAMRPSRRTRIALLPNLQATLTNTPVPYDDEAQQLLKKNFKKDQLMDFLTAMGVAVNALMNKATMTAKIVTFLNESPQFLVESADATSRQSLEANTDHGASP